MRAERLAVEGAFAFVSRAFPDRRGVFVSSFQESVFETAVGDLLFPVAQVSHSVSHRGVVRGLHYTATPPGVAKYVHCPRGRALDIVLDTRVGSPTFGSWDSVILDSSDHRAVYFPVGVAHMFVALEDETVVSYLLSREYVARNELAIAPLDPALGLSLPADLEPILSDRDRAAPTLEQAGAAGLLPDYAVCLRVEQRFRPAASP
jgi:epimerase EvaD